MLHYSIIEFLLVCILTSNCFPLEESTKFLLNGKDFNVENMQMLSKLEQPQIRAANSSLINQKSKFLDQGTEFLESLRYPPSIFSSSITNSRETVHLENESEQSLVEKTLTFPFNDLLVNIFKPTPLVDQIKEEDEYVNPVNKMSGIGEAILDGYKNFSNFLNSAISSAQSLRKKLRSNVSNALKQIGEKLTGLA